jgi:flavin reductase (DIM6/NTAB) family NADH-FMN oxidoreductase RutF
MLFDFAALTAPERYRLMATTIVPRPIAWVVSQSAEGRLNAAPFSFFNAFGDDPPVLCIGIGGREGEHRCKDTGANIRATGQFVVNLVPFAMMEAMHVTAVEFDRDTDELAEAGLATRPSSKVAPPRIADSPVAFECERHSIVELGQFRTLVVGQVLAMHVRDDAVLDAAACRIDAPKLDLVGRVHGAGGYVRAAGPGVFTRARLTLADWLARRG